MTRADSIPATGLHGDGYTMRTPVVAPGLDLLHGPLRGRHQLPLHLDASARATLDFGDAAERAGAYQLVLLEAREVADLEQWLDRDELTRLWPELFLPRELRRAWQSQHRDLAAAGAGPLVPSR